MFEANASLQNADLLPDIKRQTISFVHGRETVLQIMCLS
jgi:hypothetical protein